MQGAVLCRHASSHWTDRAHDTRRGEATDGGGRRLCVGSARGDRFTHPSTDTGSHNPFIKPTNERTNDTLDVLSSCCVVRALFGRRWASRRQSPPFPPSL
ncbi:unnamed protein product [Vitrella brassicaformis CCMP3155]|uniref:Uncharacterized protein n=1 Tax=Vitrella brassicaformis (strain CCMP3155) TaxID=1169540 RepID=A0A0G4FKW3_VITBC|nr:unnamed protein product [Vitrella brassicaformis CCMP3155]|eukprot:CEM14015.1 unnamed protein product [Vitrella brassicaformis CCMP3155]